MKRMLQWIAERITRCLDGRYGCDGLSVLYFCVAIVLAGCACILPVDTVQNILCLLALCLAIYASYRCLSKDRPKQKAQWDSFCREMDEIEYRLSLRIAVWKIKSGYRYLKCKRCKQRYRVTRVKGERTVVCPKCGNQRVIKN